MINSKSLYASKHSPPFYFSLFCPYPRWGKGDLSWAISFLIYLNVTNILKSWIFCCMFFKYIFCFTLLVFYTCINDFVINLYVYIYLLSIKLSVAGPPLKTLNNKSICTWTHLCLFLAITLSQKNVVSVTGFLSPLALVGYCSGEVLVQLLHLNKCTINQTDLISIISEQSV